ncbi:hypothetical protein RHGRI_023041 [Rhododendron griersonianum]|uniref:Retrovirus-related Pol polyprotein from transposon TNT 1-94-like beta-barrel domain-containing protein n=1 Tax=Rhododendron griersonianum TaxID=479676 RepID=A0AAV6J299_9ERIC|nr:hypothetical protein RHGRI_023041 [Rhododendron griersonianum]
MLLSCLIATLTPPILPHVVGSDHTFQLLIKLEEKFSILSRSHVHDLHRRLFSLNKTGSMDNYLDSIKEIVQKLAASGAQVDEELIFHTLNGLKKGYKSFKQTIRTRTEHLSFSSFSSMLLAEELHVAQDQVDTSTILVAPHNSMPSSNVVSTSSAPVPTPVSQPQPSPTPFQFPFPLPPTQTYFPSPSPTYNTPRFSRNNNRSNGSQFSKPFGPSQGSSSWNGFPGSYGYPGPSTYQAQSGYGGIPSAYGVMSTACQICGKTNHQASTCYYRTNLGYRPQPQFTRPQFGRPQFGGLAGFSGQSQPQAFYTVTDPMGYYGTGLSAFGQSPMQSPYGYGSTSQFAGSIGHSEASSSGYGSSAPPWYFDSGATSHVTPNASYISEPHGIPTNGSVTVGNGQTIPVDRTEN